MSILEIYGNLIKLSARLLEMEIPEEQDPEHKEIVYRIRQQADALSELSKNEDTEILEELQEADDSIYSDKTYRECVRLIVDTYKAIKGG